MAATVSTLTGLCTANKWSESEIDILQTLYAMQSKIFPIFSWDSLTVPLLGGSFCLL